MMPGFRIALLALGLLTAAFSSSAFAQQPPIGTGANFEARLQALEEQIRLLNGHIEQLEFNIRRSDAAQQRMQSDVDARFTKLESAPPPSVTTMPPPPPITSAAPPSSPPPSSASAADTNQASVETPDEPPAPAAPVNGTLGAIKVQDGKVTGAIKNPQAPPLPQTPPDYGLTTQEQYDRAFDLLRQTEYEEAGDAFKSFIDKNPKDKLIDDAKYWYAETLYVRDKYDQSAIAFADAWEQNPKSNKAPESLLKLAMSLEKLGKVTDACTTLESLKSKYTKASAKVRQSAEQEMTHLKCGAQTPAASKH